MAKDRDFKFCAVSPYDDLALDYKLSLVEA